MPKTTVTYKSAGNDTGNRWTVQYDNHGKPEKAWITWSGNTEKSRRVLSREHSVFHAHLPGSPYAKVSSGKKVRKYDLVYYSHQDAVHPGDRWVVAYRKDKPSARFYLPRGNWEQRIEQPIRGYGDRGIDVSYKTELNTPHRTWRTEEKFPKGLSKDAQLKQLREENQELKRSHDNLKQQYKSLSNNREAVATKLAEQYAKNHRLRVQLYEERKEHKTDGRLRADLNKAKQAAARWKREAQKPDSPALLRQEKRELERRLIASEYDLRSFVAEMADHFDEIAEDDHQHGKRYREAAAELRTAIGQ